MVIVAGHITVDPEQRETYLAGCMSVVERLAGQMAASTLPSRPTCSTLAASTSLSAGSRKRPSKPSAAAAQATSNARQCSRRR
jgi:hypothetical protein